MGLRDSWIEKREAAVAGANGKRNVSQIHLARQGVISEEMQYVAKAREAGTRADPQRSGARALHHSRQHPSPQPGADGHRHRYEMQINANIGNSSTSSNIDEELKKLHQRCTMARIL